MTTKSINTLSLYRPSIRALYKRSPTNWDIATWVNLVGRHINFVDHDDIYEPIELRIKVAGRLGSAQGLVTMQVDPTDASWYQTLRSALAQGMKIAKHDIPYTSLHTMRGDDIASMDPHTLHHVGQLTVRVRGTQRKVKEAFKPPANVRTDKVNDLVSWYEDDLREKVIDHVANHLVGSSMTELDAKTRRGTPIFEQVQALVEESVPGADMSRFMQLYGVNDRARSTPGADAAARIARSIISQVRKGLNANKRRISKYHADQAARRAALKAAKQAEAARAIGAEDDESSMDAPLFGIDHVGKADVTPVTYQDTENDRTLYSRIVRSALERPDHASVVVYMVYRGRPTRYAGSTKSVGDKSNAPLATVDGHYHRGTYHDHRHYRYDRKDDCARHRHGRSHHHHSSPMRVVVADANDEDNGDALAPYYDDRNGSSTILVLDQAEKKRVQAARRLQQFSGRHVFMKPASASRRRTPQRRQQARGEVEDYDPLNAPVPEAAPLGAKPTPQNATSTPLRNSSGDDEDMPTFVPFAQTKATTTSQKADDLFVSWNKDAKRPSEETLNKYVDALESRIAQDEQRLGKKLWTKTGPATTSNGMPSIFACMDE